MKGQKIHKCSLCGQFYASLNGTFHVTPYYKMRFCRECTKIVEATIRKMRLAMQRER